MDSKTLEPCLLHSSERWQRKDMSDLNCGPLQHKPRGVFTLLWPIRGKITRKTCPFPPAVMTHDTIVILDFGSQYSHVITRRIREMGVYSHLLPCTASATELHSLHPKGVILSGGPNSVYDEGTPHAPHELWTWGVPVLGICYGLQEMVHALGGKVSSSERHEYGHAELSPLCSDVLFAGIADSMKVWMSHGDAVTQLPKGFSAIGHTENSEYAAICDGTRNLYGLQFHPEVNHTPKGRVLLANFVKNICGCKSDWTMESFREEEVLKIREQVGSDGHVIGAVSGGVDSTVAAVLMNMAIGERFHAILIDNGLLRMDEASQVMRRLRDDVGINLTLVDASERFLVALKGVTDPEAKRRIIGKLFIEVFEEEAQKIGKVDYLLQGTLYPDVIESISFKGPSSTIKTHHNVGALTGLAGMTLKLIEPFRELFKDEVRELGQKMNIDERSIRRHPFPGPGLAIRILGEVTREQTNILKHADKIYIDELRNASLYDKIDQAFAVLLPTRAVGVMGDQRTYEQVIVIRAVETQDYMTADWYSIPDSILRRISSRIMNEVRGVNRVVMDISSKPPATIEWE
eukprot:TRINITY_DN11396_c0_g2_i1.p1 TRINITY_DN11396_c0_g2~~TRINITY_DN11396_c0_g2_i1.p1  ORF type:complete len:575 (-),score=94.69 TRINITY_DN11396_c0_g2_i1:31-1755(-)